MVDIIEITINEFKNNIYDKYVKLFPENEQREWVKIEETYKKGIEKFYKIVLKNEIIGFFMLEKLNGNYPFYLDYFAIFREFQNKGYGSKVLKDLIEKYKTIILSIERPRKNLENSKNRKNFYLRNGLVGNNGLIGEIEKENTKNPITIKRFKFYSKLGFKKTDSEYLLYNVPYTPIVYINFDNIVKEKIDKIFFDYYLENCGEDEVKKNCKIIK